MYRSEKTNKRKDTFDQNVPEGPALHCLLPGLTWERNLGVCVKTLPPQRVYSKRQTANIKLFLKKHTTQLKDDPCGVA